MGAQARSLEDAAPRDRRAATARALMLGAAAALVVAAVLSLSIGPTGITLAALPEAVSHWLGASDEAEAARHSLVLLEIRLPRTLLGMFVGAALAVAGAMMQGLFRNPLADPGLVGVSSGAALAAVATIALGNEIAPAFISAFGPYALPVAAFLGGIATTWILVVVAGRHGRLMIGTLLLAGVAIAAFAGAMTGLIAFVSDDRELRDLTLWTLGSLAGASWPKVIAVMPFAILILIAIPRLMRGLNGFLLGEAEAFHLGINVEATKRFVVVTTAACVGAAVAVAGVIGFIGIVVPHFVRLIAGPDHRIVLPASALAGGALMVTADIIARMLVRPAELPIGVVMAAIGAPIFLHLVLKRGIGGVE